MGEVDSVAAGGFEAVRAAVAAKGKSDSECVQVVVRCRPMSETELNNKCISIVDVDGAANQVTIKNPETKQPKSFTFDGTFDENTQQRVFYEEACFPLVESILDGFVSKYLACTYLTLDYVFCFFFFKYYYLECNSVCVWPNRLWEVFFNARSCLSTSASGNERCDP